MTRNNIKLLLKQKGPGIIGLFVLTYLVTVTVDVTKSYFYQFLTLPALHFFGLLSLILNYKFPFYAIILSVFILGLSYRFYRVWQIRKRSLKILSAVYGSGNHYIDITGALNNAVQDNSLKIVLSNNIAGDPTPGIVKDGTIKYRFNNTAETRSYHEADTIELP